MDGTYQFRLSGSYTILVGVGISSMVRISHRSWLYDLIIFLDIYKQCRAPNLGTEKTVIEFN